ncbi:MAG: hypothetical protein KBE04_12655 [Phycisphaerae bacterium]|nr:hypothetical protein [Phycisphaerae bacterium]
MIVPMSKVYIASRIQDRDRLLDALGRLGVLHVQPVDPRQAVADEQTVRALSDLDQAIRILQAVNPSGAAPDLAPLDAARQAIRLHKTVVEAKDRIHALHRQAEQLALWGRVELAHLESLRDAGLEVRFFALDKRDLEGLEAECVEVLAEHRGQQVLIGVVDRTGVFKAPESARPVPWPARDLPSVQAEAAQVDATLKAHDAQLQGLAHLLDKIMALQTQWEAKAEFSAAQRSGLAGEALFALQGWVPAAKAQDLAGRLAGQGLPAAVEVRTAAEDEEPPTLIEYPAWARPIQALFDILGTVPGYREIDLSPFFMLALPLFAAMLIGDAGYGLVLAGAGLALYRPLIRTAGRPGTHLLILFGLVTLVWGILTATYFGLTPETFRQAGRDGVADLMIAAAPLWRADAKEGRDLLMKVSLVIGCLHLVLAHLRRVIELWPDVRAWAEVAWMVILADMLALIWFLMFVGPDRMPPVVGWILLGAVVVLSWTSEPRGKPLVRALTGLASSLLPLLGTFGDIMSYLRLFAVGLASYYIADAFNKLGAQVAQSGTWLAGGPIVLFGHLLNIVLAAIAIFAHGVRLNMLEFSNNVGVKWAGYAYRPFVRNQETSIGDHAS